MLIAIPSESPGGLDASISDHFGHCHTFTLVTIEDGVIGEATLLPNEGHGEGGCLQPVMLLKSHNVDALVANGMGAHPLAGFQEQGITVFFKEEATSVREAAQQVIDGTCREFGPAHTCGGGCGGHAHAHHHVVERQPIEGKADVQKDRVVAFHYELSDGSGTKVDSSDGSDPMYYLHGHSNIVPGLEAALAGAEVGATRHVKIAAAEAYGERDEEKIVRVPREALPEHAEVGAMVEAEDQEGNGVLFTITALDDEAAHLDGNHPLAGKDLVFDVTVVSVEAATPEEIAHGHPHVPH